MIRTRMGVEQNPRSKNNLSSASKVKVIAAENFETDPNFEEAYHIGFSLELNKPHGKA